MSTAFEVDNNIATIFSSQTPVLEGIYDLTPDQVLLEQAEHESEVRSYPRRLPIAIKQAYGVLVEDTRGQIFLDCLAGAGTLALGYNHPEINQALKEQLDSGLPYQTLDITTQAKANFIKQVKAFLPEDFAKDSAIQFCGPSGADAVEAAIKLAKQTTGRNTMFAFRGAYHGMTNGTMGMMGNLNTKARRTGLMSDVHFMPFPYNLRCPFGLGGDEGAKASIRYIERLLNDDEAGIMKPAAIIVEPVQGEGGVIPAPAFWLRELRRICDEHGILLIFDEIQCGVGKTGYNFAYQESGIHPDILCLSKAIGGGLPMSILLFNKKVDTWRPGEHTGTFRGNQLAMVSGAKALEIITRDKLVEHARVAGQYLREGLEKIQQEVDCIAEVRGKGLMLGVEIKKSDGINKFGEPLADGALTLKIQRCALERGLIVEKGGREGSVIRFLPPMIISFEQIDFALRVLKEAILAAGGNLVKKSHNAKWKKHFVQTGEQGASEFSAVMNHTTQAMTALFEQVDKPYSGIDPKVLETQINAVSLDDSNDSLQDIIDATTDLVAKNSIFTQHPSCIAHLHTPPLMPAIAAETIIAALNQSMDSWDQASSATYVEQKVINWLSGRYELGAQADGIFTSGGTQSNQMGLMLARDWIADKLSGHSIQKLGLPEYAHKLRIVCSEKAHFTVQKSASWMGLGEKAVLTVPANTNGTMKAELLAQAIENAKAEGLIPFAIVGTAGTTDHGAIDDLNLVADVAAAHDLWMHVDGAYGGALILSQQNKHRLAGVERANSVSVDFHKMFYQTISCGALLVRDKSVLKFLLHHADYLNREHDELPNLVDKSIATTKRFDALKVFMTMQSVGPDTLGEMYDHLLTQTKEVADLVRQHPSFELLAEPSLSTVLFRSTLAIGGSLDKLNQKVRIEALVRGVAVLGETTVAGHSALKFTILNPCLTSADFEKLLTGINQLAVELAE